MQASNVAHELLAKSYQCYYPSNRMNGILNGMFVTWSMYLFFMFLGSKLTVFLYVHECIYRLRVNILFGAILQGA